MKISAEDIREEIIDALLQYQGFENFWYDLDEITQDAILERIDEAIESTLDESENCCA